MLILFLLFYKYKADLSLLVYYFSYLVGYFVICLISLFPDKTIIYFYVCVYKYLCGLITSCYLFFFFCINEWKSEIAFDIPRITDFSRLIFVHFLNLFSAKEYQKYINKISIYNWVIKPFEEQIKSIIFMNANVKIK